MSRPDSGDEIRLYSPAKINLGLRVHGLRPDGFHEVETWIQQVSLFDRVWIRPAARVIRVSADQRDVPQGRGNLAYRAASALRKWAGGRGLGAIIRLEKNIPSGAGLGGGSGNAAAVLWALNGIWGLGISPAALSRIAAGLGSDVPSFLAGPAAVCRGRGEIVSPIKPLRRGWIVLVKPPLSLPTPKVYGWMRENLKKGKRASRIAPRPKQSPEFRNDLEEVVFSRYPLLRECRDALLAAGARRALMSGSGAALWALFGKKGEAEGASREFEGRRRWLVRVVRPLTSPAFAAGAERDTDKARK